jgi:hypothetical protein
MAQHKISKPCNRVLPLVGRNLRADLEGRLFLARIGPFPAIPFVLVTADFLPLLESGFGRVISEVSRFQAECQYGKHQFAPPFSVALQGLHFTTNLRAKNSISICRACLRLVVLCG